MQKVRGDTTNNPRLRDGKASSTAPWGLVSAGFQFSALPPTSQLHASVSSLYPSLTLLLLN